jgi:hypothetical protein
MVSTGEDGFIEDEDEFEMGEEDLEEDDHAHCTWLHTYVHLIG